MFDGLAAHDPGIRRPRVPRRIVRPDDVRRRAAPSWPPPSARSSAGPAPPTPSSACASSRSSKPTSERRRTSPCGRRCATSPAAARSGPTSSVAGSPRPSRRAAAVDRRAGPRRRPGNRSTQSARSQGATARARLDEAHYRPIVHRLAQGPLAGRELREMPPLAGKADSELLTTVALLAAAGYAVPGVPDWETSGAAESTGRMNAMLVEMSRQGQAHGLPSPRPAAGPRSPLDPFTTLADRRAVGRRAARRGGRPSVVAERGRIARLDGVPSRRGRRRARSAPPPGPPSSSWRARSSTSGRRPVRHLGRVPPPSPGLTPCRQRRRAAGPVAIVPGVSWVAVDADVVVLDARDEVHLIDATGALIWPLLDGTATNDELAADVADVFGVPVEQARDDVDRFVAHDDRLGPRRRSGTPMTVRRRASTCLAGSRRRPIRAAWRRPTLAGSVRCASRSPASTSASAPTRPRCWRRCDRCSAPTLVESADAPDDYGVSVERRGGAGPRMIPALLHGRATLLRSRSLTADPSPSRSGPGRGRPRARSRTAPAARDERRDVRWSGRARAAGVAGPIGRRARRCRSRVAIAESSPSASTWTRSTWSSRMGCSARPGRPSWPTTCVHDPGATSCGRSSGRRRR